MENDILRTIIVRVHFAVSLLSSGLLRHQDSQQYISKDDPRKIDIRVSATRDILFATAEVHLKIL